MPLQTSQSDCTLAQVNSGDPDCYGGVSRRSQYIQTQKARWPNQTIALDTGNTFYGSLFATLDRGATIAAWMLISGYDAVGVGTVDFFGGPSLFGDYAKKLDPIPIVSSNLDVSLETTIPSDRLSTWTVLQASGRQVGIVGCIEATLASSSSAGSRVKVNGNFTCVNYLARAISQMKRAAGDVDVIIALASPNFNNRALATQIATTSTSYSVSMRRMM